MMKITINGYDVELKAKRHFLDNRYSEEQTKAFLNGLCCLLDEAANYLDAKANNTDNTKLSECLERCATYHRDDAKGIYDMLKTLGYYDNK